MISPLGVTSTRIQSLAGDYISGQDVRNRATQGPRHLGPAPEPYHEIRPPVANIEPARKLPAKGRNLDRLIQKRIPDAERGRLKGESLVATADLDPVSLIIGVRHEDDDPCGTAKLFRTL